MRVTSRFHALNSGGLDPTPKLRLHELHPRLARFVRLAHDVVQQRDGSPEQMAAHIRIVVGEPTDHVPMVSQPDVEMAAVP